MQTSYSKWWLLYFILLKTGKGERSQLTFTAFLKRVSEHHVAAVNTVTAICQAALKPSEDFIH